MTDGTLVVTSQAANHHFDLPYRIFYVAMAQKCTVQNGYDSHQDLRQLWYCSTNSSEKYRARNQFSLPHRMFYVVMAQRFTAQVHYDIYQDFVQKLALTQALSD